MNHWCHEKMTYQPSDGRTHAPLASVKNGLGRCGEESTFCVAALRSVGIPARQVYTPRWAHTESNHAWVEAWADGEWVFIGACEPEPVLNLGWFNAPASRAMLTHTKVFGNYDGPEEVVLRTPGYTEINLIDNYAKSAEIAFRVLSESGAPVEGARVDFCIYNSSQFYPAVSKYTDADGRTALSAGLGDMLVWASKDGAYGYVKVHFGENTEATITLDSPTGVSELLAIVPPVEDVTLPEVTPAQRAENDRRMAYEDSVRKAYMAGFPNRAAAEALAAELGLPAQAAPCGSVRRQRRDDHVLPPPGSRQGAGAPPARFPEPQGPVRRSRTYSLGQLQRDGEHPLSPHRKRIPFPVQRLVPGERPGGHPGRFPGERRPGSGRPRHPGLDPRQRESG